MIIKFWRDNGENNFKCSLEIDGEYNVSEGLNISKYFYNIQPLSAK